MKKNLGPLDRLIRLIFGNLFIVFVMLGIIIGEGASYLFWAGAVAIITSLISFCPLYAFFGISTKRTENK